MFNNIYKNKYLRYTNSDSADDENDNDITESENNSRNIDLIVNRLENKLNENNNMKMTSQNQETTRTSKMNESNINNFPNLIQKNIKIKENDTSIDIGDSIYSFNSLPKSKIGKSLIDVDISLNSNNLKELEKEEKDKNDNKNMDLINIINKTNNDMNIQNINANNKNNYISRNKILNTGNSSLNTLSTQFDNSKYFLTKTNGNLILSNKIKKNLNEKKNNNKKENDINMNLKLSINEDKNIKNKEIGIKNKNNLNKINRKDNKKRNRIKRKCNFITILRNIFLTIIISSAIGFYVVVFIC